MVSTQLGAGCSTSDSPGDGTSDELSIPNHARIVDDGVGPITYIARSDGRVWLYDQDDRRVLDARRIRRGQEYRVVPDQNRVTLDDKKVYDQDLKRKHAHRIYFLSSSSNRDRDTLDRENDVPSSATRVAGGTGELTYRTTSGGHVYIVDEDDNRLVYDRSVRSGQEIVVQPDDDRITVDGRSAFDGNLERKHAHRIYFERN